MNKQCQMCNLTKPVEQFHKSKQTKDGRFSYCAPCKVEANRRSNKKLLTENREKFLDQRKNWHLKKTYGITLDEYKTIVMEQGGVCAVCLKNEKQHYRQLAVDHDHTTGKVRGLLCHDCNRALGFLKDDVNYLKRAIEYLN
jgi:hypothetical protein